MKNERVRAISNPIKLAILCSFVAVTSVKPVIAEELNSQIGRLPEGYA